jgi:HAD superfamily hydrolase (TIGR01509 family)
LIFDFDGTVADTSPLHARAFNEVLAPYGITIDYPAIAGLSTRDALRSVLANSAQVFSDSVVDSLVSAKQRTVRAMIAEELEPLPDVGAFLRRTRKQFVLAMASSGSRGTVGLGLEKLGYGGLFIPLLCADDVQFSKPDPEIFLKVLEYTRIPAAAAMVFEDSDAGLTAANLAGIDSYDVRTHGWGPWARAAFRYESGDK